MHRNQTKLSCMSWSVSYSLDTKLHHDSEDNRSKCYGVSYPFLSSTYIANDARNLLLSWRRLTRMFDKRADDIMKDNDIWAMHNTGLRWMLREITNSNANGEIWKVAIEICKRYLRHFSSSVASYYQAAHLNDAS